MKLFAAFAVVFATITAHATTTSLSGTGWSFHTALEPHAHPVSVPDCWPVHAPYRDYVGDAIYERDFSAPARGVDSVVRLHFEAVYYKATIWLNGVRIGTHEGGYTPFEFDITRQLRPGNNHLVVEVDNGWSLDTIPGLATAQASHHGTRVSPPRSADGTAVDARVVGWWSYGGINRDVSLVVTGPVYLQTVKLEPFVNLATRTAEISVVAQLENGSRHAHSVALDGTIGSIDVKTRAVIVPAHGNAIIRWSGHLNDVHLWDVADPFLYMARLTCGDDSWTGNLGLRDVKVRGTDLLLNGKVVHLFGANRVSEDPEYGLLEPENVIERDLGDMLQANLRMMRIAHYAEAPALLDYADRHGMLLIAEAGNWNMSAWQMADPVIRAKWKSQMQEMMQQDWNHPSVIAWSVGNEYESDTPSGISWTRDMKAFTLGLDSSRLITFASRFTFEDRVHTGEDEASNLCDFVSINMYDMYAEHLDRAHELWPNKPVFVTEFGKFGEGSLHDPARVSDIQNLVAAVKARPWVIGASVWAYADYRSRVNDTPEDGIRKWGLVTFDRQHRDSWSTAQKLFAPAVSQP